MKKLSDSDLALLKSRGKVVNGFTTKTEFTIYTPKVFVKNTVKKAKKKPEKNPLVGKKLHTSWGYDMTMNDFCQIVEVSKTGKTVKCRMVSGKSNGLEWSGTGAGKMSAGSVLYGPTFRLKRSGTNYNGSPSFVGSYPFCGAENLPEGTKMSECSSRFGYWSVDDGSEYYENHVD